MCQKSTICQTDCKLNLLLFEKDIFITKDVCLVSKHGHLIQSFLLFVFCGMCVCEFYALTCSWALVVFACATYVPCTSSWVLACFPIN